MNFEEHFLKKDIAVANLAFQNIVTSLRLIDSYKKKGDAENVMKLSVNLTNALSDLNELAIRKDDSENMYLHHLLNYPQRWYPV